MTIVSIKLSVSIKFGLIRAKAHTSKNEDHSIIRNIRIIRIIRKAHWQKAIRN